MLPAKTIWEFKQNSDEILDYPEGGVVKYFFIKTKSYEQIKNNFWDRVQNSEEVWGIEEQQM